MYQGGKKPHTRLTLNYTHLSSLLVTMPFAYLWRNAVTGKKTVSTEVTNMIVETYNKKGIQERVHSYSGEWPRCRRGFFPQPSQPRAHYENYTG